jgi:hypothetical protein
MVPFIFIIIISVLPATHFLPIFPEALMSCRKVAEREQSASVAHELHVCAFTDQISVAAFACFRQSLGI